mmetsp:Transcript_10112/g.15128  ORF Transcript_10112/g.15128 Transcript_10112/m.15128 type:complete len:240 (+) Transcript_10112:29-748(+)
MFIMQSNLLGVKKIVWLIVISLLVDISTAAESQKSELLSATTPSVLPTAKMTSKPSKRPTMKSSVLPSNILIKPTRIPTAVPSSTLPSSRPSGFPSTHPSFRPISSQPTPLPSSSPSKNVKSSGSVYSNTHICLGGGCEGGLTCIAGAVCAVTDDFKFICTEDTSNSLEGISTCISTGDTYKTTIPCCNPSAIRGADGTCSLNSIGCLVNAPSAAPTKMYTLKPTKTVKPTTKSSTTGN